MENLNEISKRIHAGNVERGFYDEKKEFGTMLMLVTSELGEALEADRRGRKADLQAFDKDVEPLGFTESFKAHVKDTVEDEIADTMIRLFDLCGYYGIDIDRHIEEKLKYNATRGNKHGKKY